MGEADRYYAALRIGSLPRALIGYHHMTAYLTLLALILLPYFLGVHLLVVPLLFILRTARSSGNIATLIWFTGAALPLSALYVWGAFGHFSGVALAAIGALAFYTGLIAMIWRMLLNWWGAWKDKPINNTL